MAGKLTLRAAFFPGVREDEDPVKVTAGKNLRTMGMHAHDHIASDDYGARVCEVYEAETGLLRQVHKREGREVKTKYEYNPVKEHKDG